MEGREREGGGGCQANFGDAAFSAALFSMDTMERRGWDSWPFFLGSVLVRGRTR